MDNTSDEANSHQGLEGALGSSTHHFLAWCTSDQPKTSQNDRRKHIYCTPMENKVAQTRTCLPAMYTHTTGKLIAKPHKQVAKRHKKQNSRQLCWIAISDWRCIETSSIFGWFWAGYRVYAPFPCGPLCIGSSCGCQSTQHLPHFSAGLYGQQNKQADRIL